MTRARLINIAWYAVNILLIASAVSAVWAMGWEYSTRTYLRGFSDAVIPATASPIEKVQTILAWMAHGPARHDEPGVPFYRDPEETLNYRSLLSVCGSATNAFVNIANASGLPARRLLLLASDNEANHVVAEVHIDDKWIVVDPSFHFIPRGPAGQFLTRQDLADPEIFRYATQNVPNYNPLYDYDMTSHVRLGRVPFVGRFLRLTLNRFGSDWSDSVFLSLLLERRSLAASSMLLLLVIFLLGLRIWLRHFSEARLGIPLFSFRERIRRVFRMLLHEPS
jgi:transglutaminase superfamily protein